MQVFNPSHPGEIIREDVIGDLGLSVTDAARLSGAARGRACLAARCSAIPASTAATPGAFASRERRTPRTLHAWGRSIRAWMVLSVSSSKFGCEPASSPSLSRIALGSINAEDRS